MRCAIWRLASDGVGGGQSGNVCRVCVWCLCACYTAFLCDNDSVVAHVSFPSSHIALHYVLCTVASFRHRNLWTTVPQRRRCVGAANPWQFMRTIYRGTIPRHTPCVPFIYRFDSPIIRIVKSSLISPACAGVSVPLSASVFMNAVLFTVRGGRHILARRTASADCFLLTIVVL